MPFDAPPDDKSPENVPCYAAICPLGPYLKTPDLIVLFVLMDPHTGKPSPKPTISLMSQAESPFTPNRFPPGFPGHSTFQWAASSVLPHSLRSLLEATDEFGPHDSAVVELASRALTDYGMAITTVIYKRMLGRNVVLVIDQNRPKN